MRITHIQFRTLTVSLGVLALLLLPFWPYSHWGYVPSILAGACVLFLLVIKAISLPS